MTPFDFINAIKKYFPTAEILTASEIMKKIRSEQV